MPETPPPVTNESDGQTPSSPASGSSGAGSDPLTSTAFALLFLLSLGLLGWGVYLAAERVTWNILAAGAMATVGVLAAWPIVRAISRSGRNASHLAEILEDQLRPMRHDLTHCLLTLRGVEENSKISELAKRVAYREQDRDAIRRAIEEDLLAGDFAGARTLADEMEKAFGYKEEAQRFREEVRNRVTSERDRELEDARLQIDRLCNEERWADAFNAADRVISRFDNDIQVRLLRTRIEEKRQNRKVELVKRFHASVGRRDVDEATELIKRLDTYLTPEEGQQLSESAKEVFKGKLLKLRDQFMTAMHQHQFSEALRIGDNIKRDFPNSQLAREVKQHEPQLREAAGVAPEEESVV